MEWGHRWDPHRCVCRLTRYWACWVGGHAWRDVWHGCRLRGVVGLGRKSDIDKKREPLRNKADGL